MNRLNQVANIIGNIMETIELSALEKHIGEMVRLNLMSISEGMSCYLSGGTLPRRITQNTLKMVKPNERYTEYYLKIRSIINPYDFINAPIIN